MKNVCIFLHMCVILSTGGGHAWLWGACVVARGMCGCWGVCVVVEGACMVARGACVVARGHAWLQGHVWLMEGCVGYDEIRSMSGRNVSYWNAFLLETCFLVIIWNIFLKGISRKQTNPSELHAIPKPRCRFKTAYLQNCFKVKIFCWCRYSLL